MKKIALLFAVVLLSGCHALDRTNPTDTNGTNYKGMTYQGEIGSFTSLTDFTIAFDLTPPGGYYIFAIDGSKNVVNKYGVDGTPADVFSNPSFSNPTGICEMNGYFYVIDTGNTVAYQIVNKTYTWQNSAVKGNKIISYNNTTLYTVVSDPPGVALYVPDPPTQSYVPGASWPIIAKGDTSCAACMSYISDIAVNPPPIGEIMLVDSGLKRISIFTAAGAHARNIDIGSDILSVALWGNTLYVPTTDGIRRYNYTTGTYIDKIADYGEGNGRVMKPGPIELYFNAADGKYYIFVGAGSFIKVFQRDGL